MEYIAFGAGTLGKYLKKGMGIRITAFIDNDLNRVGSEYCGVPIMSLTEYKNNHRDKLIIISVCKYQDVSEQLESDGIYDYLIGYDMPSFFQGFVDEDPLKYVDINAFDEDRIYLYGLSGYSLLIREMLIKNGKDVMIIPHRYMHKSNVDAFKKRYDFIVDPRELKSGSIRTVYIAISERDSVINELFPDAEKKDIFDFSNVCIPKDKDRIEGLKNKYADRKRCFIVATGPSLRIEDLRTLEEHNEFCISMNEMLFSSDIWKPDVFVAGDTQFVKEKIKEIIDYDVDMKFLRYMDDVDYGNDPRIYKCIMAQTRSQGVVFSDDIAKMFYKGMTVTFVSMQIAVYLGFKNIYLLGVDCDYTPVGGKTHFNDSDDADIEITRVDDMILSYKVAKEYADAHGINIYNATRGGKLEVFERVDFDSLF